MRINYLAAVLAALSLTITSFPGIAQRLPPKKDSLKMSCLLLDASMNLDKKQSGNVEELTLILSSLTDTTVKACSDAVISTVVRDAEGKYEIVFYHNDYWFWLSGVSKAIVKPKQKIKPGQPIGYIQPGEKIELLLFDFETPVDPRKYLDCPAKANN